MRWSRASSNATTLPTGRSAEQAQTIIEAGRALQQAGVLPTDVDVAVVTGNLIDPTYARAAGA